MGRSAETAAKLSRPRAGPQPGPPGAPARPALPPRPRSLRTGVASEVTSLPGTRPPSGRAGQGRAGRAGSERSPSAEPASRRRRAPSRPSLPTCEWLGAARGRTFSFALPKGEAPKRPKPRRGSIGSGGRWGTSPATTITVTATATPPAMTGQRPGRSGLRRRRAGQGQRRAGGRAGSWGSFPFAFGGGGESGLGLGVGFLSFCSPADRRFHTPDPLFQALGKSQSAAGIESRRMRRGRGRGPGKFGKKSVK